MSAIEFEEKWTVNSTTEVSDTDTPDLDGRDRRIYVDRLVAWNEMSADHPRVGDVIRFSNGVERYVSHVWKDESEIPESIQTTDGGSFHFFGRSLIDIPGSDLNEIRKPRAVAEPYAGLSYSGSLYSGIQRDTMDPTEETRNLRVWFFHHDRSQAHNSVHVTIPVRVWDTTEVAS